MFRHYSLYHYKDELIKEFGRSVGSKYLQCRLFNFSSVGRLYLPGLQQQGQGCGPLSPRPGSQRGGEVPAGPPQDPKLGPGEQRGQTLPESQDESSQVRREWLILLILMLEFVQETARLFRVPRNSRGIQPRHQEDRKGEDQL